MPERIFGAQFRDFGRVATGLVDDLDGSCRFRNLYSTCGGKNHIQGGDSKIRVKPGIDGEKQTALTQNRHLDFLVKRPPASSQRNLGAKTASLGWSQWRPKIMGQHFDTAASGANLFDCDFTLGLIDHRELDRLLVAVSDISQFDLGRFEPRCGTRGLGLDGGYRYQ